jgi:hypothetical protein
MLLECENSRGMRCVEACVILGDEGKNKSVFVGKHKGKRPLGRPRCGFEENNLKGS